MSSIFAFIDVECNQILKQIDPFSGSIWLLLAISFCLLGLILRLITARLQRANTDNVVSPQTQIQGLHDFKWREQKPLQIRVFKPKYYLTMSIQKLDPSEMVLMDNNYLDRIAYRKRILKDFPHIAIGVNNKSKAYPAVRELYLWFAQTYLPTRFPTMFTLRSRATKEGLQTTYLHNLVTGDDLPVSPVLPDVAGMLELMGNTLDDDFFFLMEEENSSDPKYVLEAYVCVCPSGWNPRDKLGKQLAGIHTPVPRFKETIGPSMDRFFSRLTVGQYVKRANWTVTLNEDLFQYAPGTNHGKTGEKIEELERVDPAKVSTTR